MSTCSHTYYLAPDAVAHCDITEGHDICGSSEYGPRIHWTANAAWTEEQSA